MTASPFPNYRTISQRKADAEMQRKADAEMQRKADAEMQRKADAEMQRKVKECTLLIGQTTYALGVSGAKGGFASLAALENQFGPLPAHCRFRNGSERATYVFVGSAAAILTGEIAAGLTVRPEIDPKFAKPLSGAWASVFGAKQ